MADQADAMQSDDKEYTEGGLRIGGIITGVVAIAAAIFVFQNSDQTSMQFLSLSATVPLSVVIIISMILGSLLTWFAGLMRRRRRRRDERSRLES